VDIVHANSLFSVTTADPEVSHGLGLKCISGEAWEGGTLKMDDFKLDVTQGIGPEESS
jgi:hypothetical protein